MIILLGSTEEEKINKWAEFVILYWNLINSVSLKLMRVNVGLARQKLFMILFTSIL